MESVFVTRSGDWKLGGLEYVCELDNISGFKAVYQFLQMLLLNTLIAI